MRRLVRLLVRLLVPVRRMPLASCLLPCCRAALRYQAAARMPLIPPCLDASGCTLSCMGLARDWGLWLESWPYEAIGWPKQARSARWVMALHVVCKGLSACQVHA